MYYRDASLLGQILESQHLLKWGLWAAINISVGNLSAALDYYFLSQPVLLITKVWN